MRDQQRYIDALQNKLSSSDHPESQLRSERMNELQQELSDFHPQEFRIRAMVKPAEEEHSERDED